MRGGAGAEGGLAGVPAGDRRGAVLVRADPPRRGEQGRARLQSGARAHRSPASLRRRPRPTVLGGERPAPRRCACSSSSAAAQIEINRRAVLETDDPEAAHQLRVGLRRLRSALRAFRPLHDTPATRELQQYARESRPERRRAAQRRRLHREHPRAGRRRLKQGRAGLRRAARGAARAPRREARPRRERRFAASSGRGCSSTWRCGRRRCRTARSCARRCASSPPPRWRRAGRGSPSRARDSTTFRPRSATRCARRSRRFRYTSEFFGSLYDGRKVERFVKDLKRLQDVFGYVNDVATRHRRSMPSATRTAPTTPRGPARRRLRAGLARCGGRAYLGGRGECLAPPPEEAAVLGLGRVS